MRSGIMILSIILITLFGVNAAAQTELNGSIENQSSIRLNAPFNFMKLNNLFNLKFNSALEEHVSAYAELDLKHAFGNRDMSGYILEYDENMKNYFAVNLRELYIDLSVGIFDFRLGKQTVSWGKIDAFAPTDNINPLNYKGFDILDFSNMKIGIPMLKVDAYLFNDYLHIEGIYVQCFIPSVYPDPDSDWAFFQSSFPETMVIGGSEYNVFVDLKDPVYPAITFKNSEAGLKVSSSVGGFDFSGSYFYTWDDNPTVHQEITPDVPSPADVTLSITPEHHRLHIIGIDLAKAIGSLGLRAESAFFITHDCKGEDEEIADPYLKWAVGTDFTFFNDFTINLQLSEEIQNLNFTTSSDVEILNSIIAGISAGLLEERLRIELSGIYEVEEGDYLVIPKIEYGFTDSLNIALGIQIFEGEKGTQFGSYDENDALFIKVKYSF